jgi:hypothetical protein
LLERIPTSFGLSPVSNASSGGALPIAGYFQALQLAPRLKFIYRGKCNCRASVSYGGFLKRFAGPGKPAGICRQVAIDCRRSQSVGVRIVIGRCSTSFSDHEIRVGTGFA